MPFADRRKRKKYGREWKYAKRHGLPFSGTSFSGRPFGGKIKRSTKPSSLGIILRKRMRKGGKCRP